MIQVTADTESDAQVLQQLAHIIRRNDGLARQLRDFADTIENDQIPSGIRFQPKPGQLLACHFGLGFQVPENVKTRPVLVISPHQREWTKLCVVVPISSQPPRKVQAHHFRLPKGVVPGEKYDEAWVKGDLVVAVAAHRLDRLKVGFRDYRAPMVHGDILKEARRCVLHAAGMNTLTEYW